MPVLDRAVGIDLGTTNSEIAWLPPSEREIVMFADRFGRKTIPSAVAWDAGSEAFLVGHSARAKRGSASSPAESIKRKMGQKATVALGPHTLAPEEISAKILGELKARMAETLAAHPLAAATSLPVTRAVITVPAYFDAPQVEATRRAGELAGLDVVGILQEPTAAAIYHTWRRRLSNGNFLVYDLGGGTFDVSILRCVGGEYQVLAIDGDNFLGGDDFDRRFAEHLRQLLAARGYALELDMKSDDDRRLFGRLVHVAQEVKESLSTTDVVQLNKSDVARDKAGESISIELEIGRADYEATVADLVETTVACCERALARSMEVASVGIADIDHVVLVGGSTRVPLVVRRVTEVLSKRTRAGAEPIRDDVDTCVALGAAVHAAHVGGTVLAEGDMRVRVTTPLVSQATKARIGLTVEASPAGATSLAIWEGENALAEGSLAKGPLRLDATLGEVDQTNATIAFQTAIGAAVGELPLTLYRGDLRPRPTALSRASVIAKDIALEVVRGGKRDRKVLLARGTGLPASATHMFFTADRSGAVVLRLLQDRLPIKTVAIDVPETLPVGSPVELVLRCDESMRIEAEATIGAQHVRVQIDPPPTLLAEAGDVEALLDRAEKARRALWGDLASEYAKQCDRLVVGIREVLQTDPDKLAALCARLRHLIDELHGGVGEALVPPMARMEEALDALRRLVFRWDGPLMGMDRAEWEARIEALDRKAMAAHAAGDGPTWRRVFNEVQALAETAYQEEFAQTRLDDPTYIARRFVSLGVRLQRLEQELVDLVPSTVAEVRMMQAAEQARIEKWLDDAVKRPLVEARRGEGKRPPAEQRRALEAVDAEIDRIESAVERLPSLGLVTDRGAGG